MLSEIIEKSKLSQFSRWLRTARRVVIVGHVSPDGDAIGSSLAMSHFLLSLGIEKVNVIVPNVFPDFLKWLPGASQILIYNRNKDFADKLIEKADIICCQDFNASYRVDAMETAILASKAKKILIDHHLDPETFCDITISIPSQSSTCELLFRLIYEMGYYERMTQDEATCLYTGMMTDTGGFVYNSNKAEIYTIIGLLIAKGIDKDAIYRKVFYVYSEDRLRMQGYVLSHMRVLPDYHTAIISLTREELGSFRYKKGDSEGFVNLPLQIKDVIFSCFLNEDTEKNQVKLSLRSVGDFPCNKVAEEFGGGGHLNASGGELVGVGMEEATKRFLEVLEKYRPLLKECYEKSPK